MSPIRINWKDAESAEERFSSHSRELSDALASLKNVKAYRCMRGSGFTSVYQSIDREISRLEEEKDSLGGLKSGLGNILEEYKRRENGITGEMAKRIEDAFAVETNDVWDIVSEFGWVGQGLSMGGRFLTEGWSIGTGVKSGKDFLELFGNAAAAASESGMTWRNFLGFTDGLKDLDKSGGWKTFHSSLSKQFGKDLGIGKDFSWSGSSQGERTKVGAKWGAHFLTAVENGIENYEEFKNSGDTGRGIGETVIESAVDVGLGALATAGASALAGSLAAGAAAAGATALAPLIGSTVVVGALGAGIAWAANGVCKWFNDGKDIGETISDGIFDAVEGIRDKIQSFGRDTADDKRTFTDRWF